MNAGNAVDRSIGARIRMRRHEIGMTMADVAEALTVSPQQIQKYEKGQNRVAGSRLAEIAEVLGVTVGFFYHESTGGDRSERDVDMDEFMASNDGLIIARAFVRIPDPKIRATVAASIKNICEALEPERRNNIKTIMAAE